MPLYEYACEKCGDRFEVMQKFSDQPLTTHDKCGGAVHRLISAPALQFKGSGWYITDYARGGTSTAGENGSAAKSETAKSTESTADKPAKPAAPAASPSTSESKSNSSSASSETK